MSQQPHKSEDVAPAQQAPQVRQAQVAQAQVAQAQVTQAQAAAAADILVVERARNGDPVAFELIMRRYNQRLYRLARSIVKNGAEAEDVVQEAYVRAYEKLADFVGPGGFSAWLGKIVINEALGRRRKSGRVISLEDYVKETGAGFDQPGFNQRWADTMKSKEPSPERLAANSELGRLLEGAINSLPDNFRTVFVLRAIEGMTVLETADMLSIRPETVKTRFHRARQLLQVALGAQCDVAMPSIFPLGGEHCDHIVAAVLGRLGRAFEVSSQQAAAKCRGGEGEGLPHSTTTP